MHTPLYNEADYSAITAQMRKRWQIVGIPCVILAAVLVVSLYVRLEWLTVACTLIIGVMLIAGYDLFIKPLRCYLENASFSGARGMTRAAAEPLPETIKVRLISANGEVTGIGTISTKTGEGTIDSGAWYSLDGRRIEGKPSTKGVYVNNGKKVIINK
jgi:hypothetical protein